MLEKIQVLIDENKLDEAMRMLDDIQKTNSNEMLASIRFLRGKVFYKQQKWGDAINCFNEVLETDPNHAGAKTGIEMTYNILGFFNPDMFNP